MIVYCVIRYLRQLSTQGEQIKLGNENVLNPVGPYQITADGDPFLNAMGKTNYEGRIGKFNRVFIDHSVHFEGKETILALAGGIKYTDEYSTVAQQFLHDLANGAWTRFIIGNSKWQGDPNAPGHDWTALSYGSGPLQGRPDLEVSTVLEQLDSFTNGDEDLTKELSCLMTCLPLLLALDHLIAHRNQLQNSALVLTPGGVVNQCRLMKLGQKTLLFLRFDAEPILENKSLYVNVTVDITAWKATINSRLTT